MIPSLLNLFVCSAIISICVCRLDQMRVGYTLPKVMAQYVALLTASAGSLLAPFNHVFITWQWLAFDAAVLYVLWSDSYQWRRGTPFAASYWGRLIE